MTGDQNDVKNKSKIIVIGKLVEEDLFTKTTALGKYVDLSGIQYKVVGIFEDDGDDDQNRMIYMPVSTAQQIYGSNDYLDQMNVTYIPSMSEDEAIAFSNKLERDLKKRFMVHPDDQRAVRVFNMAENAKAVNQMNGVLGIIVMIVGLGTLIAGIVGISNIMIFIVKERTKEIGIRKALGAQPKAIISIILIESVVITSIAGYLGLLLGMGLLKWFGPGMDKYFITDPGVKMSLVVAATITLIIAGALAGYLPAKRASKIKPIVALRND